MRQGGRRGFAGQRDDLADLLGREIARVARTRAVGQEFLDRGAQALGLARQGGELVLGVRPAPTPLPDTVFIEIQGVPNRLVGFAVGGAQHDPRAPHQAVGGFAASGNPFEQGALFVGQVNQRGWTGHRL